MTAAVMNDWASQAAGVSADTAKALAASAVGQRDGAPQVQLPQSSGLVEADVVPKGAKVDSPPDSDSLLETAADFAETVWTNGIDIWTGGGWAMIALAVISYFIFFVGIGVFLRLRRLGVSKIDEPTWRRWIHESADREGVIGRMFSKVDEVIARGRSTVHDGFDEIRTSELGPFQRDLKLMNIAVGAAPLVGLLGTVTGMLTTFDALGSGSGGGKTMDSIAGGISEALYTTEAGLVVALPGLFFHYFLSRRFDRFRTFLDHAESVWSRDLIESKIAKAEGERSEMVRALVTMEVKRRVLARLSPARA